MGTSQTVWLSCPVSATIDTVSVRRYRCGWRLACRSARQPAGELAVPVSGAGSSTGRGSLPRGRLVPCPGCGGRMGWKKGFGRVCSRICWTGWMRRGRRRCCRSRRRVRSGWRITSRMAAIRLPGVRRQRPADPHQPPRQRSRPAGVPGKGLPRHRAAGRGSLNVLLTIRIPTTLNHRQRRLYEQLREQDTTGEQAATRQGPAASRHAAR